MPVTKHRRFPFLNGEPRYLRIFRDDRATIDRFVVFFIDTFAYVATGRTPYLALGEHGTGYHGEVETPTIDHHASHEALGKEITFAELPEACQRAVLKDYREFWS